VVKLVRRVHVHHQRNVGNYELRKLDDLKYVKSRFRDTERRSMLQRVISS